jgi:PHD/YefM family antitoxin component YafN of YafNO toxin-antitoxin module
MQTQKANLHKQAIELIQQLSTEKLKAVIDYLTYLQDKEAWEATHELASQPEVVESLKRAEDDVKAGKLKSWGNVRRNV